MKSIAIAGAGVAGLGCAIMLAQQQLPVTIFEQVANPTPIGAGLLLQPSGQAVLDKLGLLAAVREQAAVVNSLQGYSGNWRTLNLHYAQVNPQWHGLGVHRAALHGILWRRAIALGVNIELGNPIRDFRDEGNSVVVIDASQVERRFDALVIANGTRSQLRKKLQINQTHRPYPWGAYWAVLDHEQWPFPDVLMQRYRGARIMLGILPTGTNPGTGRPWYSLFWSLPCENFSQCREQGMGGLIAQIAEVWSEVAQWLSGASDTTIAIAEYADVRMQEWNKGRVAVIGDAAHAMSPQLGQGANIALIDAWVMANCLLQVPDIEHALQKYSALRKPHIHYYQMASNAMTPLYQSKWPLGWFRDIGTVIGQSVPAMNRQYLLTLGGAKQGLLDLQASREKLLGDC